MEIDKKIIIKLVQVLEDLKKSLKDINIENKDSVIEEEIDLSNKIIHIIKNIDETNRIIKNCKQYLENIHPKKDFIERFISHLEL